MCWIYTCKCVKLPHSRWLSIVKPLIEVQWDWAEQNLTTLSYIHTVISEQDRHKSRKINYGEKNSDSFWNIIVDIQKSYAVIFMCHDKNILAYFYIFSEFAECIGYVLIEDA